MIWEAGANGEVGFRHNDPANQPDFFAKNPPPDYNSYHLPDPSGAHFVYDNNNSRGNRPKAFSNHRASGADVHGTVDTNYTSGFPTGGNYFAGRPVIGGKSSHDCRYCLGPKRNQEGGILCRLATADDGDKFAIRFQLDQRNQRSAHGGGDGL